MDSAKRGPQEPNPRPVVALLKQLPKLETTLRGQPKEADYAALATVLSGTVAAIAAVKATEPKAQTLFTSYRDLARARLAEIEEARALLFPAA